MTAEWTYLTADLRTNVITGEMPLTNVQISKILNDVGTLTADWKLSQSTQGDPATQTTPARTCVYALRNGVPYWGGILWTRRYDSTTQTVSLGCADWWSYFDHRKVVQLLDTIDGITAIGGTSVIYTGVDQNAVARNLITLAQTHTGGDLGIVVDASLSGALINREWDGYSLASVGDELRTLTKTIGGPDVMFDVGSPPTGSNKPTRLMLVGDPKLGQQGSPHVFEYGGNVISYTWPSDGTAMGARAWAVGNGIEEGTLIAVKEATALYADGWPLLEVETGYPDVTDVTTLVGHAEADQAAANLPVVIPTLTVNGAVPPMFGEAAPGDDAQVIINDGFFVNGVNTRMRIVGVSVQPGDNVEQPTYTMNPTLEDVT